MARKQVLVLEDLVFSRFGVERRCLICEYRPRSSYGEDRPMNRKLLSLFALFNLRNSDNKVQCQYSAAALVKVEEKR